jgi:SAM-dependent methyltransferase
MLGPFCGCRHTIRRVPDDPVDLMFGGMAKLGPGSDDDTNRVLALLPDRTYELVVDAGCGTGRQTLALAKALRTVVHGVDVHQPFLDELKGRAHGTDVENLVHLHRMDMIDIASAFNNIDLLWSEGAAYNIGFERALSAWAPAIASGGYLVVSELCWLRDSVSELARDFFQSAYPDMGPAATVTELCERAGYRVLSTYTLPRTAWLDGFYDELGPRATALRNHSDSAVRSFAEQTLLEIGVFQRCIGDYGYVFFVLQGV